jgi:hypothetical protein
MDKKFLVILGSCLLLTALACQQAPNEPQGKGTVRLSFRFGTRPAGANLFNPTGSAAALGKSNRSVTDRVLTLHCDSVSTLIDDASPYGNDGFNNGAGSAAAKDASMGKALSFDGFYSVISLEATDHLELNGGNGLELTMWVKPMPSAVGQYDEQRLFDRHDPTGGFRLGLMRGFIPYFTVKKDSIETSAISSTALSDSTWHELVARFADGAITLNADGKLIASQAFAGPISNSSRPTLIGAGWQGTSIKAYFFSGSIDEVTLNTTVEYEEMNEINIAVIDLSKYSDERMFKNSQAWSQYSEDSWQFFGDSAEMPTWDRWLKIWDTYFDIANEQSWKVTGGYVRGTIGVAEGFNLIAVGGVYNGRLTYYGIGYLLYYPGGEMESEITLWPALPS